MFGLATWRALLPDLSLLLLLVLYISVLVLVQLLCGSQLLRPSLVFVYDLDESRLKLLSHLVVHEHRHVRLGVSRWASRSFWRCPWNVVLDTNRTIDFWSILDAHYDHQIALLQRAEAV